MAKVLGNGDEDVAVEGTQLHHCCSQAKLKYFLGMFLVKVVLMLTETSVTLRSTLGL